MTIFGIDPGKEGGIGIISAAGEFIEAFAMPIIADEVDALAVADLLNPPGKESPASGAIESPLALPGLAVRTVMNVGKNYGALIATIKLERLPYEEVTPSSWKRTMKVTSDKESAVKLALQLFPAARDVIVTKRGAYKDGIAEALLIAEWKRRKEMRS